jgi:hypothetical protein
MDEKKRVPGLFPEISGFSPRAMIQSGSIPTIERTALLGTPSIDSRIYPLSIFKAQKRVNGSVAGSGMVRVTGIT